MSKVPKGVVDYLRQGCRGEVAETPKALNNCYSYVIGDNRVALEAMREKAGETGFAPCIVTAEQKGDTAAVARSRASEIISSKYSGHDAILIGGETAPRLPAGAGKGGRNQHYAAVSMLAMEQYPGEWVAVSLGTDGSDFLPDVAGAIVDNSSLENAGGIDVAGYLDRYDSNTLLNMIGDSLIITGPTGTNVGDVILYLLK